MGENALDILWSGDLLNSLLGSGLITGGLIFSF
jgi:hypothetical protein